MARRKKAYRGIQTSEMRGATVWLKSMRKEARHALSAISRGNCAAAYDYVLATAEDYQRYSAGWERSLHDRAATKRGKKVLGFRAPAKKLRTVIEAYRRKCVPK